MKIEMNKQKALSCLYSVFTAVAIVALAVFAVFLTSCRTIKEVPVEVTKTQIEYRNRYLRDSILTHDSTIVYMKGDTQYIYRDRYQYRDRYLHDTICKVDSIPYIKEVERRRTEWEEIKNEWGGYSMLLLLILVVLIVVYVVRKIVKH